MSGQRRQIENKLKSLPESMSADEIEAMYANLQKDVDYLLKQGQNLKTIESQLHKKHETLAYAYPTVFFKAVRGEMDPHMFKSLMQIKRQMDDGKLTEEGAKRAVVDGVKEHIMSNPNRRKPKPPPGSTTYEISTTIGQSVENSAFGR